ncbi:MAG: L-rhamnose mutarotase [Verrucomicrobia bacterium]|nr:L-rhamnose mutarotase [Verrucomicrobiota bacterium]
MKTKRVSFSRRSAALGLAGGCASGPVKRVGMVVQLRPEKLEEYKRLHAASNPGVRDLLVKYHLRNFSIFLQQIDGKWYEFGYYEYTGKDFDADMAKLDAEPRNKEWLKVCDPMQMPLPGAKSWTKMERVYFNE